MSIVHGLRPIHFSFAGILWYLFWRISTPYRSCIFHSRIFHSRIFSPPIKIDDNAYATMQCGSKCKPSTEFLIKSYHIILRPSNRFFVTIKCQKALSVGINACPNVCDFNYYVLPATLRYGFMKCDWCQRSLFALVALAFDEIHSETHPVDLNSSINFLVPTFSLFPVFDWNFIICTYFTIIAASGTVNDDVTNYMQA